MSCGRAASRWCLGRATAVSGSARSRRPSRRMSSPRGSDAVRWVLGEQSPRLLRGGKMEDVIFQGSTGRRPVNVAEVSLVFDNSDGTLPIAYQEVMVTRRLSRSGQSE